MFIQVSYVASVVVLSACINYASAISCYSCNSYNNTMCVDPTLYDTETINRFMKPVDCNRNVHPNGNREDFFCRKVIQTILSKGHELEVRVTRGCGWVKHHKQCYKADTESHLETVCQCFSDNCNSATKVHSMAATTIAIAWMGLSLKGFV